MYKNKKILSELIINKDDFIYKNLSCKYDKICTISIKKNIDDYTNLNENYLKKFIHLAKRQEHFFTNKIKPWNTYIYEENNSAAIIAYDNENNEILGWMNINYKEIYFDELYYENRKIKKTLSDNNFKFYVAIINNIAISNNVNNKENIINKMLSEFKYKLINNIYLYTYNKENQIIEYKSINIDVYSIYSSIYLSSYFEKNYDKPDVSFDINYRLDKVYLNNSNHHTLERRSDNIFFKNIKYNNDEYSISDYVYYRFKSHNKDYILKYIKQKLLELWIIEVEKYLKNY